MRIRSSNETGTSAFTQFNGGGRRGQGFRQPKPHSVPRPRPLPKPGTRR
ncbi:hypothetical protein [Streptomyces sp. NBC_01304]|nr:hypothetical protein OG430_46910 [Streptomyces sp. NBC_01304]